MPQAWRTTIGPFVPMQAGSQIFVATHHEPTTSARGRTRVFSLYAAAALALGSA